VRPRILFVVTLAETGGAQTYVASLLAPLADRFDVAVAAHGDGPLRDAARAAGVRFLPLTQVRRPVSLWRDVLGLLELLALLRGEHPHIVHLNSAKAAALGRLAAWLARVPIRIYTVHGWAFRAHGWPASALYRWAERVLRPLTTVTVCVADSERRAGLAAHTCVDRSTVVIRNGVEPAGIGTGGARSKGQPRLIAVGRLQAPKDAVTLVRALAALRDRPFEAVLVCDGPDRPAVEEEVRRLGLESAVELLGERDDVPELLGTADVFVLSSNSEGLPLSILEAMAAGLPVVASNVGGVSEVVLDGDTGLLVPPGDAQSFAAAIERLLEDPVLRGRLGEAGRIRVAEHFDLAAVHQAHLDLYRRVLATRGLPLPSP
jgi:glycosyltransferase involved in cell wall biosynthesis